MAVNLAKSVFQLAAVNDACVVAEVHRLRRMQFEHWFANHSVALFVMEAGGSAHNRPPSSAMAAMTRTD